MSDAAEDPRDKIAREAQELVGIAIIVLHSWRVHMYFHATDRRQSDALKLRRAMKRPKRRY